MSIQDTLQELHNAISEDLLAKIQSGEASAAELAVAVKFLKDNGIDCYAPANEKVSSLANVMQFPVNVDDDEAYG